MSTLTYSGEQTVDVQNIAEIIGDCDTLHRSDNDIRVKSISLRFTDTETCRVVVSMSGSGTLGSLDTLRDAMQQEAANLGFEQPSEEGEEEDPTDGIELL